MQKYFHSLADFGTASLRGKEVLLLNWRGESSDFCRFNHAKVRQAGHVDQRTLVVRLIDGGKQAVTTLSLTGSRSEDERRLTSTVAKMREQLPFVPADPHLLYATEVKSSEKLSRKGTLDGAALAGDIIAAGQGQDLVGILAVGAVERGFANSLGQRNWYQTESYNFDWSIYSNSDKAVKCGYAGYDWSRAELDRKMADARHSLEIVGRPAKIVQPGKYRAYLAPAALREVVGLMSWGGFGLKSNRTKQSCLNKLIAGDEVLSPKVSMSEAVAEGISPDFDTFGFRKPTQVTLINKGKYADAVVSARSSKEYSVPTTGADEGESPESFAMASGGLRQADALKRLGTGFWINNLWYLNFSDRNVCRMTGMTRFATFWVENGVPVAPVNVMRFDDSVFRVLGTALEDLTNERDFIMSADTYVERSTSSHHMPGALIGEMTFTL